MVINLFEYYIAGAISIIGMVEWIKHLNIKNINKFIPYISFVLCMIGGICAAKTYEQFTPWNIFVCFGGILSCVQLGYQAIVQSICGAIDKYINKTKESEC